MFKNISLDLQVCIMLYAKCLNLFYKIIAAINIYCTFGLLTDASTFTSLDGISEKPRTAIPLIILKTLSSFTICNTL